MSGQVLRWDLLRKDYQRCFQCKHGSLAMLTIRDDSSQVIVAGFLLSRQRTAGIMLFTGIHGTRAIDFSME